MIFSKLHFLFGNLVVLYDTYYFIVHIQVNITG